MLDNQMKEQLKEVFSKLEGEVEFQVELSQHADQLELLNMLEEVSSTSPKIKLTKTTNTSLVPKFQIYHNGKPTGITCTGIPGGHEFTSLILAILNSDLKGKMPDALLTERIRHLKGPIQIKTFFSLTCENCPDVVQALNQMAILHPQFEHHMVDGGYVEEEVKTLGIQGVPSLVVNSKLIHSGRINFLDLLIKLENTFGTVESSDANEKNKDLGTFDVVVVGGGPAGASSAIYSVRKGLKTAMISEKIGGQVQETRGIENLISVPYTEGPQLAAHLAQHVGSYPVQVFEHRRVKTVRKDNIHEIELETGEKLKAKSIIVATGAKWRELNVPGEREYIGRGVAFCPHCDGPYYKGKKVAVVGGGNSGVEAAIDLAGIVREVVLIEFNATLKADQILVNKLKSLSNVSVITNAKTLAVLGDGQKVNQLEYEDRELKQKKTLDLDGVFVQIGLIPNSQFLKDVVELTKFGEIVVDNKGRTSVPGIYAAGDVTTTPYKQIIIAMGEGAKAALAAFEDQMIKA